MRNAREDLGANVPGAFSPDDWDAILTEAQRRFDGFVTSDSRRTDAEAWRLVMIEFTREAHWGFKADYRPPRRKASRPPNLGLQLIWILFVTFTGVKMGLAWWGQRWTRSGQAFDKYVFLSVIALTLANAGVFLWRTRHHRD